MIGRNDYPDRKSTKITLQKSLENFPTGLLIWEFMEWIGVFEGLQKKNSGCNLVTDPGEHSATTTSTMDSYDEKSFTQPLPGSGISLLNQILQYSSMTSTRPCEFYFLEHGNRHLIYISVVENV